MLRAGQAEAVKWLPSSAFQWWVGSESSSWKPPSSMSIGSANPRRSSPGSACEPWNHSSPPVCGLRRAGTGSTAPLRRPGPPTDLAHSRPIGVRSPECFGRGNISWPQLHMAVAMPLRE